jgi:hypothetical protein
MSVCKCCGHKKALNLRDYIADHGWEAGMMFATVDVLGRADWHKTKPRLVKSYWPSDGDTISFSRDLKFDATDWGNSLLKRCVECGGTGRVGPGETCSVCGGRRSVETKQFCSFTADTVKFCSSIHSLVECCSCRLRPQPAKTKLSDLTWPAANDGWTMRMVEKDGTAYYTNWKEGVICGNGWHGAPSTWSTGSRLRSITDTLDATNWETSVEKHPRYDDIIWFQRWGGKTIGVPGKPYCYTVRSLSCDKGFFNSKKNPACSVNCHGIDWREVTTTIPLTPLDFRNIRGIRYRSWAEGCEQRILTIDGSGVSIFYNTKMEAKKYSFEELAKVEDYNGTPMWWSGYTFDGQVVSLAKTSYEEL